MTTQSRRVLALCFLALTASGCDSDEVPVIEGSDDPIRFDAPEVGQQSRYAVLVGDDYRSPTESPYRYVQGAVFAEIVAQDDVGYRVREWFEVPFHVTEASARLEDLEPDAVYEYYLRLDGDAIEVLPADGEFRARLFPGWAGRTRSTFPLDDIVDRQTEIVGWRTALPYCECYAEAFILGGEIRGETYDRLNVVVDDEPMQVDGPGATKLYSARLGIVRSTTYDWWTASGVGLDLIPVD